MHGLKTGALIHASVMAHCLLIDTDSATQDRFSTYGKCICLAFQVHDDILDVTGESTVTGKIYRADAALNKPTFPSILGLEESRNRARSLRDEALTAVDGLPGDTSTLAWLADYVITRDR